MAIDIPRRVFIRQSGLALLALGLPPGFLTRSLLAGTRGAERRKTLVCVFMRGAVDGLSMVVPFGDSAYYARRRSIAIPQPGSDRGAIDLDGFFGLHPALAPVHPLYARGELAIIHAVGSPHPTRSHFDAQDFMESGTPGVKSTRDGWLNRVLTHTPCDCGGRTLADPQHAADHAVGQADIGTTVPIASLRGVAMSSALPRSLRGRHPALAIGDLERFGIGGGERIGDSFARLYRSHAGEVVGTAAQEAFEAMRILRSIDPARYRTSAEYPNGNFGRALRQIAQLIKADVGVEIAFADIGGWDTHYGQGGPTGQLARRLAELARGLRALYDDLGPLMENVVVLTMSEFGRTVAENGSGGTDHGHANCMLALGGGVRGGTILGDWPGLQPEQLYQGRDLDVTTDFRDVFAEIAAVHLGANRLEEIFPGYRVGRERWRGVLG